MDKWLNRFILILVSFFASTAFAQRTAESNSFRGCQNEPENSQAGIKYVTGGKSLKDLAFGTEQACLNARRITVDGRLKPNAQINGAVLDRYFDSCSFKGSSQFSKIKELNDVLSLKGRDLLVDGVWQEIAHRSHFQLVCRQQTLDVYSMNVERKAKTNSRAQSKFNEVIDDVRELLRLKEQTPEAAHKDVHSRIDCSGVAWLFCRDVAKEKSSVDVAAIETRIAAKLSLIPFGYEPHVADALLQMAAHGKFDERAYAGAMQNAQKSYRELDSYWDDKRTPAGKDAERFCITREFKEQAALGVWSTSDQILQDLPGTRLTSPQKAAVQCYLRSHYRDVPKNERETRHLAIAGVTGASIGLSAVATGGGSLIAATALGLNGVLFLDQLDKAVKACTANSIVVSSTGAELCDAENAFDRESNQTEKASCGVESAWAAVAALPVVGASVKAARNELSLARQQSARPTNGARPDSADRLFVKQEAIPSDLASLSTDAFTVKRVEAGTNGGRRLTVETKGSWGDVRKDFSKNGGDITPDLRSWSEILGKEEAGFFGYRVLSDRHITLPDHRELRGSIDRFNLGLAADAPERIGINVYPVKGSFGSIKSYVTNFARNAEIPISSNARQYYHDTVGHGLQGLVFNNEVVEVMRSRANLWIDFVEKQKGLGKYDEALKRSDQMIMKNLAEQIDTSANLTGSFVTKNSGTYLQTVGKKTAARTRQEGEAIGAVASDSNPGARIEQRYSLPKFDGRGLNKFLTQTPTDYFRRNLPRDEAVRAEFENFVNALPKDKLPTLSFSFEKELRWLNANYDRLKSTTELPAELAAHPLTRPYYLRMQRLKQLSE